MRFVRLWLMDTRRDFSLSGLLVSAGSAFIHRPFPEVRRFISCNQVKMRLPRVFMTARSFLVMECLRLHRPRLRQRRIGCDAHRA